MFIIENIHKIFILDTLICSINGFELSSFQMNKHNWTYLQWKEYKNLYIGSL